MASRLVLMLAVLVAILSACGGGSGTDTTSSASTASATQPAPDNDPDEMVPTEPASTGETANTTQEGMANVTVGEMTWELTLTGDSREQCVPDLGGTFFVAMFSQDGNAALSIVASGSEADEVQVGDPAISGELWIANASVYIDNPDMDLPPGIGVKAQVDGNRISGTATFYEGRSLAEARTSGAEYTVGVREGTFEAACPSG